MSDSEASGRVRGATEALSVLQARPRVRRPPMHNHVMTLLAGHVDGEAWNAAGLPDLPLQAHPVPVSNKAVIALARLAVSMHCLDLDASDRPAAWSRLESFFALCLPASAPELVRLRAAACQQRQEAGCMPTDLGSLRDILELQRKAHGNDSYIAGLTRANLADAGRQAGDFELAAGLLDHEANVRASRYGRDHPVTLVTQSMLARLLLHQADATGDTEARLGLAGSALSLINDVRTARDRLYGVTATNATRIRRYEGHALLLLGELDRARSCLEHALTFVTARDGRNDLRAAGLTHLLLARVHAAAGNRDQALEHAANARQILSPHGPLETEPWEEAALTREIAELDRTSWRTPAKGTVPAAHDQ
jgi:tetratricopeptide (TPR) repeat protein